ncbi:hypothetical protein ARALYDRAFT_905528 [Arabidopsis lyrata subsp. lyrata]|uniref:Ribosome biogenesis protein NOP53 n=1 Tax=Arabidopsis lyrata subsp. lyrata TaxID=81972 RepID=D7LNP7_ARALL|nr:hypothetical protein ARALYDRAFT_905528 [Arabidopsis lyrata subsp. lyrata]
MAVYREDERGRNQHIRPSKPKLKKNEKAIGYEEKACKQVHKNVGDDSVIVDLWADDSKGEDESNPRKICKKPSIILAVEIEHRGWSYNPTSGSHRLILCSALNMQLSQPSLGALQT